MLLVGANGRYDGRVFAWLKSLLGRSEVSVYRAPETHVAPQVPGALKFDGALPQPPQQQPLQPQQPYPQQPVAQSYAQPAAAQAQRTTTAVAQAATARSSWQEVARRGEKLAAVKLYREEHNTSLMEAKKAVEAFLTNGDVGAAPAKLQNRGASSWQEYAQGGNTILAIKLYREAHGVGLKEAKEAVEAFLANGNVGAAPSISQNRKELAWQEQARTGNKILAIKLYREAHGVGLKEAKEAVEAFRG